ncbi:MAG: glycosyltransferase family 2 protein [Clostridia bacterium]|nr:glycosyltransferase family 2 protein [Clostridia bacterium]
MTSNQTPLVSVILSTFRRDESLLKAAESLSKQTYKNIEVLIADDNADKACSEKVSKICGRFGFIHIQNAKNLGSAENRNNAVRHSSGEYIAFLDDDDEYFESKIERQLGCMLKEKADACIENLLLTDENGKYIETRTREYMRGIDQKALMSCHLKYHMSGTDSLMFTRVYFDAIGGFPPINRGDEFYLMSRAIEGGGKIVYHDETGAKAVVHSESGLSGGNSKLICEKELFRYKKQFKSRLSKADWRYIVMRHHAVNAFAYVRMKKYFRFFLSGVFAFLSAPVMCLRFLKDRFLKGSEKK